jgi:hypothetical protein
MNQPVLFPKEITIMQQSQSKLALDFLLANGIKPTAKELWAVTEIFVLCCAQKQDDDLKKRLKDLDKWIRERKNK